MPGFSQDGKEWLGFSWTESWTGSGSELGLTPLALKNCAGPERAVPSQSRLPPATTLLTRISRSLIGG